MRPRTRRIWRRALLKRQKPCSPAAQDPALTQEPKEGRDGLVEATDIRLSSDEASRNSCESVLNDSSNGNSNSNSNSNSNGSSGSNGSNSKKKSGIRRFSLMSTRAKGPDPATATSTTTTEVKTVKSADDLPIIVSESRRITSSGDEEEKRENNLNGNSDSNGNVNGDSNSNGNGNSTGSSITGDEDAESTPRASREDRPSSVTFDINTTEAVLSSEKKSSEKRRSNSFTKRRSPPSPPPPSAYSRGVSFDTFDNRDATDYSLTLNYKHKDYKHTRRSRTFLCGTDSNDYSDVALEWLIDELVDDGDEIVCLRVVEKDSKLASEQSVDSKRYHEEGRKLFESVVAKIADTKAISLIMELAVGKVQGLIQRMIQIYEPASLIVGTRGRSLGGVQGLLPGSVSKYCLQQSPVPVIVVRPSNKREKKKQKRRADPTREHYGNVLRINDAVSGKIFDNGGKLEEEEAAAVAQAIGLPSSVTELPMRSSRGSLINKESTSSLKSNSEDVRVMESPSGSNEDLRGDKKTATGEEVGAVASGALSPRMTTISFEDDIKRKSQSDVIISPTSPVSAVSESSEHVKISKDDSTTKLAPTLGLVSASTSTSSSSSSSSSSTPPSQPIIASSDENAHPKNTPAITTSEADTASDAAISSKSATPSTSESAAS